MIVSRAPVHANVILRFRRACLSCRSLVLRLVRFLVGVRGGVLPVACGRCGRGDRLRLVRRPWWGAGRRRPPLLQPAGDLGGQAGTGQLAGLGPRGLLAGALMSAPRPVLLPAAVGRDLP